MPQASARRDAAVDLAALAGTLFADLTWVDETGSTNADLLAAAAAGAPEGLVLVADHQTAGRGRRDRSWSTPSGSALLCSFLLRPDLAPAELHCLTMATAVAAVDAVAGVGDLALSVKWPNDLVAVGIGPEGADLKCAGILAEARWRGSDVDAVVVGIGLNVNTERFPAELASTATSLRLLGGRELDRGALVVSLLAGVERWYRRLGSAEGRAALLDAYRERSATIGRAVRVELDGPGGDHVLEGVAVDVSAAGRLVVRDGEVLTELSVGDVVHLRPARREPGVSEPPRGSGDLTQ